MANSRLRVDQEQVHDFGSRHTPSAGFHFAAPQALGNMGGLARQGKVKAAIVQLASAQYTKQGKGRGAPAVRRCHGPIRRFVSVSQTSIRYLGPYRLSKRVYTGHATEIWRAYHDARQQFVAIKTLADSFRRDRERIGQLRWEAKLGGKLEHPRIIRVYEFALDRGTPYLVMEWFPAPSMRRRIHDGLEPVAQLLPNIILQATEALAYFNDQGWVHRDIKPDNFLVDDQGNVKLIDFALARRKRGLVGKWFSQRSKVQGTRSYMSPEQIRSYALDERADLYSLGCTFFHLVAGVPPFTGASTKELLGKHLKAPPPSLEAANPNVTPAFSQLIRRTMAKRRSERPASARKFLIELRSIPVFLNTPASNRQAEKAEG